MNGKKILIKKADDTDIIAASTSCAIKIDTDMLEACSTTTGAFREFVAGRKEWSFSLSFLVLALADVLPVAGIEYSVQIIDDEHSTAFTGKALCKSVDVQAQVQHLATGAFAFQGSGPLVQTA